MMLILCFFNLVFMFYNKIGSRSILQRIMIMKYKCLFFIFLKDLNWPLISFATENVVMYVLLMLSSFKIQPSQN